MSSPLDEACAILDEFEKKIADKKAHWERIAEDNPDFEQLSPERWAEKVNRMWLHGATDVRECNELERWLTEYPATTALANSSAWEIHNAWRAELPVSGGMKVQKVLDYDKNIGGYIEKESQETSAAFYAEDDRFEIIEPLEGETLFAFTARLAQLLEEQYTKQQKRERKERKFGDWLEERAIKSFLDFIRTKYPLEQTAFIEHMIPQKMDMHFGRIIRVIPLEAYPIPEKTAAEILSALAHLCRNGRVDARHTALESFTFSLLCIACSRIRLPKTLQAVRSISPAAVLSGAEFGVSKNRTFGQEEFCRSFADNDFSVLQVPTWFGNQPLKIANLTAALLKIVARIPSKKARVSIFQKSRKSVDQMFKEALKVVGPDPKYGNITYLSLLINQPHIHGDHRPQLKYKISK